MIIGNKEFKDKNAFYIMGILNVTPDSFSDGGHFNDIDKALFHTEQMLADGCDMVDIGGESTRPGHIKITEQEEIERVCPYIEAIRERFDVPISLDTYKAKVAEAGILAGAHLINDIWGLKWEEDMAKVLAKHQVAACLMHNRHKVREEDTVNPFGYYDVVGDVMADLYESVELAKNAGMDMSKVMLDPGIGFAKTLEQNLQVMKGLPAICQMEYPMLLGTSRKSMIGLTLDLPVTEREEGTLATSVYGAMAGCVWFRVHDVKANKRALEMTRAMLQA